MTAHNQNSQFSLYNNNAGGGQDENNNNNNNNNNNKNKNKNKSKCSVPETSGEPTAEEVVSEETVLLVVTITPNNTLQYNYYVQVDHAEHDNNNFDEEEDLTMSDYLESFPNPDEDEVTL
ncbi:hypothetical protein BGZ96_002364 [Linnemannia gamsii]|uniref:Uncharacterized protein n=1 Tax=Linnemannia gamsii TaxID=64522 RepID=A0ABQ7JKU9_9FUNG|nr:hypothetical protein BGZ96_002364 [Linnemannia gamsii]